ncbi:MAG TPA: hypothetical protein VMV02_06920 [Acidimicrobiales bacterium]|nr:hypothetical protein [Acidimicrobiales bacterium]
MSDLRAELEGAMAELAYAAVGFAVLGVQRATVARRQLEGCAAVRVATGAAGRAYEQARAAFDRAARP